MQLCSYVCDIESVKKVRSSMERTMYLRMSASSRVLCWRQLPEDGQHVRDVHVQSNQLLRVRRRMSIHAGTSIRFTNKDLNWLSWELHLMPDWYTIWLSVWNTAQLKFRVVRTELWLARYRDEDVHVEYTFHYCYLIPWTMLIDGTQLVQEYSINAIDIFC